MELNRSFFIFLHVRRPVKMEESRRVHEEKQVCACAPACTVYTCVSVLRDYIYMCMMF